ncbi:MAG: hypothetical protein FWF96_04980, partial [Kiritimatiellaeota bacterium]|nr:hypothetical protein [Kiritimatiellota bacterium]
RRQKKPGTGRRAAPKSRETAFFNGLLRPERGFSANAGGEKKRGPARPAPAWMADARAPQAAAGGPSANSVCLAIHFIM